MMADVTIDDAQVHSILSFRDHFLTYNIQYRQNTFSVLQQNMYWTFNTLNMRELSLPSLCNRTTSIMTKQ